MKWNLSALRIVVLPAQRLLPRFCPGTAGHLGVIILSGYPSVSVRKQSRRQIDRAETGFGVIQSVRPAAGQAITATNLAVRMP
jgi:hypothetical protein